MLHPEFAHMGMTRGDDTGTIGKAQSRPEALEQDDDGIDILLFLARQMVPPDPERIRIFHWPFHRRNITDREYRSKTF
jgi:hypothetical protein